MHAHFKKNTSNHIHNSAFIARIGTNYKHSISAATPTINMSIDRWPQAEFQACISHEDVLIGCNYKSKNPKSVKNENNDTSSESDDGSETKDEDVSKTEGLEKLLEYLNVGKVTKIDVSSVKDISGLWKGSKQRSWEEFRERIKKYGAGKVEIHSDLHDIISQLLYLHPDKDSKIGDGIDHFKIQMNQYKTGLEIIIHRVDGTSMDFSYKKCIMGNFSTPRTNLLSAMRHEIRPQILNFKAKYYIQGTSICSNTKCEIVLENDTVQVDHKDIPFQKISDDFITLIEKRKEPIPTEFGDDPKTHEAVFKTSDKSFASEWYEYHHKSATYQLLCKTCNVEKSNHIV